MTNIEKFYSAVRTLRANTEVVVYGDVTNEDEYNNNVKWVTGTSNGEVTTTNSCPHSEITWTLVKAEMDAL